MHADDLDEVIRFIRLFDTDDARHAKNYFKWYLAKARPAGHLNLVAEERKTLLGVGGFEPADDEAENVYWISWFYVHPDHHGTGVGTKIMRAVSRAVAEVGGRKLYVDVSANESYEGARRFYDRHGFEIEATLRDYYAEGEDCVYMAKKVRQLDTRRSGH
ncbi:MAG: GNAT family N-acetyltransferase [Deltaproteobacteria bacterium]|nr:GNAT family N-acetyltransferase [Deltaproteobacteria bacterium]